MPERGWRKEWQLYYRPLEVVAALALLIFVVQRVSLPEQTWWSETRYGWIVGNTAQAQAMTVVAAFTGFYGILPRPRHMNRNRLLFHNLMRSVGAGIIILLNGLTMVRSFEAHGAAPVATWGLVVGFVVLYDVFGSGLSDE